MTVKSSNNIIGEPEEPPFVPTEYKNNLIFLPVILPCE